MAMTAKVSCCRFNTLLVGCGVTRVASFSSILLHHLIIIMTTSLKEFIIGGNGACVLISLAMIISYTMTFCVSYVSVRIRVHSTPESFFHREELALLSRVWSSTRHSDYTHQLTLHQVSCCYNSDVMSYTIIT